MDTQLRIIYRAEGRLNGSVCDLRDFCGCICDEMSINADRWYRAPDKDAVLLGYVRTHYPEAEWHHVNWDEIKQV